MKLCVTEQEMVNETTNNMDGVDIKAMDVLCGRGKQSFNHSGNCRFRDIVDEVLPTYIHASSRTEKSEIVTSIVNRVREVGGRFLKRDGKRGVWYVLNYTQSKEKAGHAIRDATITEDSKKERAKKRKLQRAAIAKKSRKQSMQEESFTSNHILVTPEKEELYQQQFFFQKAEPDHVDSRDSLKSALCASLKQKHFQPMDVTSLDMAPVPMEAWSGEASFNILDDTFLGLDPFMDYIDEVLGPSPAL